jgi:hypothetical protein
MRKSFSIGRSPAIAMSAVALGIPGNAVANRSHSATEAVPEVIAIAADVDSAWLARLGFFERQASGRAIIAMTGHDLGAPRDLIERLGALDGVDIITGRYGREFRLRAGTPDQCKPDLFLNGGRIQRRGGQGTTWFLDLFRPHEIDGIELYSGENSPVGHPEECGALLVWSKYRAGRSEVDFSGIVFGRVIDTQGQPIRNCAITLEPGDHTDRTDAQGQFTFVRVTPGLVNVRAGAGDAGLLDEIEVRASARTTVEISRDDCTS